MFSWIAVVFSVLLASLWCIDSLLMRRKNRKNGGLPPGPKGLPLLGSLHMLSDLPHYDLHKLAQKYGPIMHMRLGVVPTIVISSPEAAELFLKTHDLVFASRPKLQAAHNLNYWEKDVVFAQYGSHWRNMRKVCTLQLLSATKIESMKSTRTEDIEGFVKALKYAAEAHEVVDLTEKVVCLIEDNTYGMIFGRKYEMLDFKESANEMLRLVGAFNLADYVPLAGLFDLQGIRRSMKGASKVIDVLLENIISEHVQHAANKTQQEGANHHKNFIDIMLSLTELDSEYQLDRGSMKATILDMILGAIDTSSVSIDWTLCELFKHPNIMKKVQSELENVVGMDRMIEESDLVKLEYLDLVVKESMRLHPVIPIITPRESREDIVINGYQIPKQSRILVNAWAIGRDPNAWFSNVDVNEFYPERFLGTNVDYRGNDFRFLPFGSGRRGCPGLQLGILMVQLVLAHLLHCFNWELPDGISPNDLDMKEKPGITTPRAKPLLAIPTFRLNI